MAVFNLPDMNELEILRKRIVELEKDNQDLRAEILECKKADETLNRDRSLLESVTQATDFMLAFFDSQFNFLWVNPAYAESCHMKPEEMVGKNHFVLYPHEENEAIFRKVRDTGEGVFYKDKPFIYLDQPERGVTYWDWSLAPVKNSDGNVTGLVLSLRETTNYRQAQEALREAHEEIQTQFEMLQAANEELQVQSEELQAQTEELEEAYEAVNESEKRYRLLFTNMTQGFLLGEIIYGKNGKPCDYRHLEANPAYEFETGVKREQILGKSLLEAFPKASPLQLEKFCEVAISGQSTNFEIFSQVANRYFEVYAFSPEKGKFAAIFRDITERKQMENDLKINKERLQDLLSSIQDGFLELDREWRFTYINKRAANNGNFEPEELIGGNIWEKFSYMAGSKFEEVYRKVMDTRLSDKFEIKSVIRNQWYEVSVYPSAAGISVFWRDITDRKRAEESLLNAYEEIKVQNEELQEAYEALSKSEERYRMLFTNMTEGFLLADIIYDKNGKPYDYRFLEINPAYELNMSIKKEQLLGKTVLEVFPNASQIAIKKSNEVVSSGKPVHFEIFVQTANKYFEVYAFSPEKGMLAAIFRDITERRRAEDALRESQSRLETVFAAIPDAIIEYDINGKPVRANEAAIKAYGLSSPDLTRDKAVEKMKITHLDNSPVRVEDLPTSRALTGKIIEGELYRFTNAEGKELVITTYAAPLFKDDKVNGAVALWHDITELKQAEESLHRSEKLYRTIAKNFPNGAIFVFDRNLRFLVAEGEALEHIGWSQEILEGRSVYDLDEETRKILEPRYRRVLEGRSLVFETAYRGRVILSQYVPIRNEDGEISTGLVVSLDITERKAVEANLSHQQEILQNIFDNIPVLLTLWNPCLEKFTLNRYAEHVLGWTTEDANNGDFMARVYPDPTYRAEVSSYMLSLKTGWREWICTTKHGQRIPVAWANIHLTDDTMIGIGVDLRERKKAEIKLKETLDTLEQRVKERTAELEKAYNLLKERERSLAEAQRMSHLGNWEWDIVTDEFCGSDEAYRIFGIRPEEQEISYNTLLGYVHPDDREYVDKATREILEGKKLDLEYRIISNSGEERIIHTKNEVIFDEKNTLVRMRGIIHDITERKLMEETLVKIEETRIKEIHHRIKNNLQVISSLLDLEAERFSEAKVLEAFKESQNRIASMALIHEELYQGKGTDNLDFAAYIQKLTQELFSSYNLRNEDISLKLNLEQSYLGMDTAIPLGIIVNELISNSFKHAFLNIKEGEIKVSLKKAENFEINKEALNSEYDQEELQYTLTVADNGIGIPEEISLEDADSLGLQLVSLLVEQIDGRIKLKRDLGTEFTIWFSDVEK